MRWDLSEHGRGPTGTAIRTGLTTLVRHMAADTSLASSGPLPTLGETARMVSGSIPSTDTGAWEVDLLYRLEEPDDGAPPAFDTTWKPSVTYASIRWARSAGPVAVSGSASMQRFDSVRVLTLTRRGRSAVAAVALPACRGQPIRTQIIHRT